MTLLFKLFIIVIVFSPLLVDIGVPSAVLQFIICLLAILSIKLNSSTAKKNGIIILLLFILTFIDKVNDFMSNHDIVQGLGPLLYVFLVSMCLSSIQPSSIPSFFKFLHKSLPLAIVAGLLFTYISGIPWGQSNKEICVLILVYWMLTIMYGKSKLIITLLVIFLNIFLLDARTMVLSMSVFYLGYYILRGNKSIGIRRNLLFLEFAVSLIVIVVGVLDEFYYGIQRGSGYFSGHGLIWGLALEAIFNSGSIKTILLGLPTDLNSLSSHFAWMNGQAADNTFLAGAVNLLEHGHVHSSIVYYILNTGVLGLLLLFYTINKSLRRNSYVIESFCFFSAIFIAALFNGLSLTSIYTISTFFLVSLLVEFPPREVVRL